MSRPSILLVDDVEANLVALEALLADVDCDLVRAESGTKGCATSSGVSSR